MNNKKQCTFLIVVDFVMLMYGNGHSKYINHTFLPLTVQLTLTSINPLGPGSASEDWTMSAITMQIRGRFAVAAGDDQQGKKKPSWLYCEFKFIKGWANVCNIIGFKDKVLAVMAFLIEAKKSLIASLKWGFFFFSLGFGLISSFKKSELLLLLCALWWAP